MVEAEPPHHLQFCGAVDAGDFDVLQFRELDGDRTDTAPGAIDQDSLTRSQRPIRKETLHGELAGLRERSRLLEGHTCGFRHQGAFGSTDILRKAAPAASAEDGQIAVDLVSHAKTLNAAAHRGDSSGDV